MFASESLKYGTHQSVGRLMQQWVEESTANKCPILPATLKFKDLLRSKNLDVDMEIHPYLPVQIEDHFPELEVMGPSGGAWDKVCIQEVDPRRNPELPGIHTWEGQVAPGMLIIEEMKRTSGPYTSEISQAIYKHYFPIESLKYIYMLDVCNGDTKHFVTKRLYSKSNGLYWPDGTIREWENGTPEFEGLLGTQLGRTAACVLLGAFERGTRRIARIRTYHAYEGLQIRFEIEEIGEVDDIEYIVPSQKLHQFPLHRSLSCRDLKSTGAKRQRARKTQSLGPMTRSASRRQRVTEERKRRLSSHDQKSAKRLRRL
ncbi:hypothetical protein N7475_002055 [Penicillium sp. IBT 31633x]|nr:hypothetical protein N7475_002055 [Penicillium sp. IBT 31633x]